MTWEEYYDKFYDWAESAQIKKLPSVDALGPADEVTEGMGLFITAPSKDYDFVSRTFFPKIKVNEDPVCVSAHCNLIPYWSKRLGKDKMIAFQASPRGGIVYCENKGERVIISGNAALYSESEINIR